MAGGVYKDIVTNQLADGISKSGGLGLGKVLAMQMSHGAKKKNLPNAAIDPSPHGAPASRWLQPLPSKGAHHPERLK
jgi:Rod binding domain-containing protein